MNLKATFVPILVSLLVFYVSQAHSSVACYSCKHSPPSENDTDCKNNSQQIKYIKYCGSSLSSAFKDDLEFNRADNEITYKCATVEIKNSSMSIFQRDCVPSFYTCDLIKTHATFNLKNGGVEKCNFCDTDICNSSNKISIAIFTLIPCLIAYFIFK